MPGAVVGYLSAAIPGEAMAAAPANAISSSSCWLCAPLTPMQFNDLYCLSREAVHTLSIGAARPSDFDRDHALPWWSYVIVSVQQGRAAEVLSWELRDDRSAFDEERVSKLLS